MTIGFEQTQAPVFYAALKSVHRSLSPTRWIYVPYDQLTESVGPITEQHSSQTGLIFIESTSKGKRRPYHKQKLALVLSNQRHFALEQAKRGCTIHYIMSSKSYLECLDEVHAEVGTIHMMEGAERELRCEVQSLVDNGKILLHPNGTWLTSNSDFLTGTKNKIPWRMDFFYQYLRRKTGILMDNGKPIGGRYSLDGENRKFWKGVPDAPTPPTFEANPITQEVKDLINSLFSSNIGTVNLEAIPSTKDDTIRMWQWVQNKCLAHFGPFEDAMSINSRTLFHSCMSSLINMSRILPIQLIDDVLNIDIPLSSKEGFVRQILGWREFMRHVHRQTDGFRIVKDTIQSTDISPCSRWHHPVVENSSVDGGSTINALNYQTKLPDTFWGKQPSGLYCLDHVVNQVMETGYTHHIPRLMILANLATLLEIHPREITDWFWVSFIDAYDWVVEPNVLGMGTYATGPLFTTKPYISGSNYINKMSDYCSQCTFNPQKTCPIRHLYWAYIERHKDVFSSNFRMKLALRNLSRRSIEKKDLDSKIFQSVQSSLKKNETITLNSLQKTPTMSLNNVAPNR